MLPPLSASPADSGNFLPSILEKSEPIYAPILSLPDLKPNEKTLIYNGRVTLLHFWASWCLPCQKELPEIEVLQKKYHDVDNFKVITVAADNPREIQNYVNTNKIQLPILVDQYGKGLNRFKVRALPMSYLIDKQGRIRYLARGYVNWSDKATEKIIEQLLTE